MTEAHRIIHSPDQEGRETPYQGHRSEGISRIQVFKEFVERLQEIGGLSHIIVIYLFHEPQGYRLLVKIPSDNILHGLFATRPPYRPCPLGLTAVELGTGEKNLLKVKGPDGIDTNPLLDVKPCAAAVAKTSALKSGWQEGKLGREEC